MKRIRKGKVKDTTDKVDGEVEIRRAGGLPQAHKGQYYLRESAEKDNKDRLKACKLTTLHYRMIRWDLGHKRNKISQESMTLQ